MEEFIMEYELQNVKSIKTRSYLTEVISDYNNKNYRSAIVVLYSIVVFDLLNKLKILDEVYSDIIANEILTEVEKEQKSNPNSPMWEKKLINSVVDRTELLNKVDAIKIQHLIDDRNMSAHPIYNNNYELINPNREQVRAHIRNMFEALFTKEALLCKKIVTELLENVNDFYDKVGFVELEKHLNSRYFLKMNTAVKSYLFRTLWKFVFKLDDKECKDNRRQNFFVLKYLVKENTSHYIQLVENDKEFYNNIKPSDFSCEINDIWAGVHSSRISALLYFISHYEGFAKTLNDSVIAILDSEAKKHVDFYLRASFLSNTIPEHIEKIKTFHRSVYFKDNWTSSEKYDCFSHWDLMFLFEKATERGCGKAVLEFLIDYFVESKSFAASKSIYNGLMKKLLEYFDKEDFANLLNKMNSNSQIYGLHEIFEICNEIKRYSDKLFGDNYNYNIYENLIFNLY